MPSVTVSHLSGTTSADNTGALSGFGLQARSHSGRSSHADRTQLSLDGAGPSEQRPERHVRPSRRAHGHSQRDYSLSTVQSFGDDDVDRASVRSSSTQASTVATTASLASRLAVLNIEFAEKGDFHEGGLHSVYEGEGHSILEASESGFDDDEAEGERGDSQAPSQDDQDEGLQSEPAVSTAAHNFSESTAHRIPPFQICSRLFNYKPGQPVVLKRLTIQQCEELKVNGYTVVDNLISRDLAAQVKSSALNLHRKGRLEDPIRAALLSGVPPDTHHPDKVARGDHVMWLTVGRPPADSWPLSALLVVLQEVYEDLAQFVRLRRQGCEYQVAVQPGGTLGMTRHRDAAPDGGVGTNAHTAVQQYSLMLSRLAGNTVAPGTAGLGTGSGTGAGTGSGTGAGTGMGTGMGVGTGAVGASVMPASGSSGSIGASGPDSGSGNAVVMTSTVGSGSGSGLNRGAPQEVLRHSTAMLSSLGASSDQQVGLQAGHTGPGTGTAGHHTSAGSLSSPPRIEGQVTATSVAHHHTGTSSNRAPGLDRGGGLNGGVLHAGSSSSGQAEAGDPSPIQGLSSKDWNSQQPQQQQHLQQGHEPGLWGPAQQHQNQNQNQNQQGSASWGTSPHQNLHHQQYHQHQQQQQLSPSQQQQQQPPQQNQHGSASWATPPHQQHQNQPQGPGTWSGPLLQPLDSSRTQPGVASSLGPRRLTCMVCCNSDWEREQGGVVRIWPPRRGPGGAGAGGAGLPPAQRTARRSLTGSEAGMSQISNEDKSDTFSLRSHYLANFGATSVTSSMWAELGAHEAETASVDGSSLADGAEKEERSGMEWQEVDGEVVLDVAPTGGRLLLFLSGAVEHAISSAATDIATVTAWF